MAIVASNQSQNRTLHKWQRSPMSHTGCSSKILRPFTNPVWVKLSLGKNSGTGGKIFTKSHRVTRRELSLGLVPLVMSPYTRSGHFSSQNYFCLFEPFTREHQLINCHRRDHISYYFANHLQPILKLREQIRFWKVCLPWYSPDNRLSEMKRKFKATGVLDGFEAVNIESKNCK